MPLLPPCDTGDNDRFAFDFDFRSTLADRILPTSFRMELLIVAPTVGFLIGVVCVSMVCVEIGRDNSDDDAKRVF